MRYLDQVAIITGGTSGIGKALAELLAGQGAKVVVVGRDRTRAQETVDQLGKGEHRAHGADVTDAAAVQHVVDATTRELGRLDLMFNNAGMGMVGDVRDVTLEDWRRLMEVNFYGVLHGVMAAYPFMASRGSGHIINTASLSGLVALPAMGPYTASKFAVVGLSKSLRAEGAPLGVKVSYVCPATVATGAFDAGLYRGIDKDAFARALPSKPITAQQCAKLIMRGVDRNHELIAPGQASVIASVERFVPAVTRLIARKFGSQVRELRGSDQR